MFTIKDYGLREVADRVKKWIKLWTIKYEVHANGRTRRITLCEDTPIEELRMEWLTYTLIRIELDFITGTGWAYIGDNLDDSLDSDE